MAIRSFILAKDSKGRIQGHSEFYLSRGFKATRSFILAKDSKGRIHGHSELS